MSRTDSRIPTWRTDTRVRLLPALLGCVVAALTIGAAMHSLQERETSGAPGWLVTDGVLGRILGDTNEAQFYGVVPAAMGMMGLALLAHVAAQRRHRLRGFDISYGSGLLPWVMLAATLGLLFSHLLWGWTRIEDWQPTFVPFVSVPPAIVLVYGRGLPVALTGGALGALLATPLALATVNFVCIPLGLPNVVGSVTGMWSGALLAFFICRWLPWMNRPEPAPSTEPEEPPAPETPPARTATVRPTWLPRRILADFTEPQFYGNEWATLGLFAGLFLVWSMDPHTPAYASGLVPQILTAQLLTAALCVWWHANRWQHHGWYPTFVPIVSVVPGTVLMFGGGWLVIAVAMVLGVLIGPPLAQAIINRLPDDFHLFIGSVMSMTATTLIGVGVLTLLDLASLL